MIGRVFTRNFTRTYKHSLNSHTIQESIIRSEYAVRGAIAMKAMEIERQMETGAKFGFDKITHLNIGNPQDLGQKPIDEFNNRSMLNYI